MPEIDRAWISIDHKLFLWDYIDGCVSFLPGCTVLFTKNTSQELASFMDQPDVIIHVALAKPKQGMFVDNIKHLLVICTPVSVLLIGVALSPVPGSLNRNELQLYATDLSISTDVEMGSVIGTDDGRIFMRGAQDGHLYEFHYQEKESWFGKRVYLIDHSRGAVQSLLPRFVGTGSEGMPLDLLALTSLTSVQSVYYFS